MTILASETVKYAGHRIDLSLEYRSPVSPDQLDGRHRSRPAPGDPAEVTDRQHQYQASQSSPLNGDGIRQRADYARVCYYFPGKGT